jgi:hypothetical protein
MWEMGKLEERGRVRGSVERRWGKNCMGEGPGLVWEWGWGNGWPGWALQEATGPNGSRGVV